jgi:hypothetical protein
MAAGHRDVIEADLTIGVAAESSEVAVEREAVSRLLPCSHDEHSGFGGKVADGYDEVVLDPGSVLERIDSREVDRSVVEAIER